MVGLQSLLDPVTGQGWGLGAAWDINNKGQIVGVGRFEGEEHAYLLTPSQCPAPRGLLAKLGCADRDIGDYLSEINRKLADLGAIEAETEATATSFLQGTSRPGVS